MNINQNHHKSCTYVHHNLSMVISSQLVDTIMSLIVLGRGLPSHLLCLSIVSMNLVEALGSQSCNWRLKQNNHLAYLHLSKQLSQICLTN